MSLEKIKKLRKPYEGVWNIVKFNWHFYVFAFIFLASILFLNKYFLPSELHFYTLLVFFLAFLSTFISLAVSFYVYDCSNLYQLNWIEDSTAPLNIININAGFDETSVLLAHKFKNATLYVLDFYDPTKHTEVSIKRARKAYPPYPTTQSISTTSSLDFSDDFADKIFLILAAHEIRNNAERSVFFQELHRILKPNGQIIVVEHLRDLPNFLAYNLGFFHFLNKKTWQKTFATANLHHIKEEKITSFITVYITQLGSRTQIV